MTMLSVVKLFLTIKENKKGEFVWEKIKIII